MESEIKNRLKSINWDFGTRLVVDEDEIFPFNNRKFHSYPGTFIPEIPFSLIEILSREKDIVMDPFGGIGTTFVQALIQKRMPISIDNNSIASRITKDFFVLFNPRVNEERVFAEFRSIVGKYNDCEIYSTNLLGKKQLFEGWYEEKTLNQIAYLITEFESLRMRDYEPGLYELFHLSLSNLLTTACSQHGGWAYIADNVKPKPEEMKNKNAIDRILMNAELCVKTISKYKQKLGDDISFLYDRYSIAEVVCEDFSRFNDYRLKEKVDLVITSPPYPRMIDYVKSQRLSFYLEERDFDSELLTEIGARARRNKPEAIKNYVDSMRECNERIFSMLKTGGYLCYVLPDFSSDKKPDRKEAIDELIADCETRGMEIEFSQKRCIPGTQRSNNIKWASLKQEQIIVLEKK